MSHHPGFIHVILLLLTVLCVVPSSFALLQGEKEIWTDGLFEIRTADWWITRGSWNDRFGEGKPYDASPLRIDHGDFVLMADKTDQVAAVYSRPIAVPADAVIHIRRRMKVHAASRKFGGALEVFGADPGVPSAAKPDFSRRLFGVTYQNMDYETDLNCIALITGTNYPAGPGKYQGGTAPSMPGIWDEEFDEELAYDPRTGDVSLTINDLPPLRARGEPLKHPCIKLLMHPYGWGTGHEMLVDYIEIFTKSSDGKPAIDEPPTNQADSGHVDSPEVGAEGPALARLLRETTEAMKAGDAPRVARCFRNEDRETVEKAYRADPGAMAKMAALLAGASLRFVSDPQPADGGEYRSAEFVSKDAGRATRFKAEKSGNTWSFVLNGGRK